MARGGGCAWVERRGGRPASAVGQTGPRRGKEWWHGGGVAGGGGCGEGLPTAKGGGWWINPLRAPPAATEPGGGGGCLWLAPAHQGRRVSCWSLPPTMGGGPPSGTAAARPTDSRRVAGRRGYQPANTHSRKQAGSGEAPDHRCACYRSRRVAAELAGCRSTRVPRRVAIWRHAAAGRQRRHPHARDDCPRPPLCGRRDPGWGRQPRTAAANGGRLRGDPWGGPALCRRPSWRGGAAPAWATATGLAHAPVLPACGGWRATPRRRPHPHKRLDARANPTDATLVCPRSAAGAVRRPPPPDQHVRGAAARGTGTEAEYNKMYVHSTNERGQAPQQ